MKIDRLVSIILQLLNNKKVLASSLASEFEVSLRTIYRDIEAINMAGIPIYATRGVNGGFQIMEDYKISKLSFSSTDLATILTGLINLKSMVNGSELINAISKVKNFIPPEKAKEIDLKVNQIMIDNNPWIGNGIINQNLEIIKDSFKLNQLIKLTYLDKTGEEVLRVVEPCQLVLKGFNWYLYGYCHLRCDYRLFKLSRIIDLTILPETFVLRDFPKPCLNLKKDISIIEKKIKLKIHKSLVERVLDYCSYANFTKIDDDYYFVFFPYVDNDYYYDILLGFGPRAMVVEPENVKSKLKAKIKELNSLYF